MSFLTGCRASKESKARSERADKSEIGVELRKADSLWSSIAERLTMKIEFYPPSGYNECDLGIGTLPTCPQAAQPETVPAGVANPLPWQAQGVGASGTVAAHPAAQGTIESIEFSTERTEDRSVITATDSVLEQKTASTETRQEEKASELRQDNGTWAIVSVVTAVAFIVIVLIVIRKFFK